jgi:hypothetical protein
MSLIICPGMHSPALTESLLADLDAANQTSSTARIQYSIFPSDRYPPYSAFHILETLHEWLGKPGQSSEQPDQISSDSVPTSSRSSSSNLSLVFLSFSAGVVGAIGAARTWQRSGGEIKAFIAVDGWGVPLRGDFPLYRLSHDFFTHWSSAPLGTTTASFYADPPVPHLELWRSPYTAYGYQIAGGERSPFPVPDDIDQHYTTAATFLNNLLAHHGEFVT